MLLLRTWKLALVLVQPWAWLELAEGWHRAELQSEPLFKFL